MYKLLTAFQNVFTGRVYRHRSSTIGDGIAAFVYEDLIDLAQSPTLLSRMNTNQVAVNTGNQIKGQRGRRGDGTFGRVVPGTQLTGEPGFKVPKGYVANLEIGTEVKIGATKLIAQVDRVINDLTKQAHIFINHNPNALRLALVGVNSAHTYTGHEKDRQYVAKTPPAREAAEFARRIEKTVGPHYDELLILRFRATNNPPYNFEWVDLSETEQLYGSILVRLSAQYERRF
ncbi:MAG TPA: hypothetical protein VJM12_01380 [Pyrinomonadaceae bacterium]|nr:hypothetical protein [Pyrinomonadaceae bacterium]